MTVSPLVSLKMNVLFRQVLVIVCTISLALSENTEETRQLKISVDNITPNANDYVCTSVSLPDDEQYIVKFQPEMSNKVHHLLLFSCEEPYSSDSHWDCMSMGGVCHKSPGRVIYAWANHADGLELPEGVGFRVGAGVKVKSLVLQLHYGNFEEKGQADTSAVTVTVTKKRPPNIAGVYLLLAGGRIPAGKSGYSVEGSCTYNDKPITPFAYRVHAHAHSTLITGYYRKEGDSSWLKLGNRSPQEPQAFYPIEAQVTVHTGDVLGARCLYDTSDEDHDIKIGPKTSHEMCNFYMMFYTANDGAEVKGDMCGMNGDGHSAVPLPEVEELVGTPSTPPTTTNDEDLPTMVNMGEGPHEMTPPTLKLASDWYLNGLEGDATSRLLSGMKLGQVSGVSVDGNGDVYILHRGSRVWDISTFDVHNLFQDKEAGPISEPVLLHLSSTGQVLHKMGANMFYLPHGLTVDDEGSIWITDVALHQVFKFRPNDLSEPVLTLGVAFQPGEDHTHFCKPSSVAVATDGNSFFVADGYCNRRIMQFSKSGEVLQVMDQPVRSTAEALPKSLNIPHSLTLLDGGTKLMVADRENGRLITMETADLSHVVSVIENFSVLGHRLFAVAAPATVTGATTPYVFVVNQEDQFSERATSGFTVDLKSSDIVQRWVPEHGFAQPHDVAVSGGGQTVYVAEIGPNRIWKFSSLKSSSVVEQARNRSIGFDETYDIDSGDNNSTVTDGGDNDSNDTDSDGIVRLQDETNMPHPDWDENLHDDTSPKIVTANETNENTTQEEGSDCPSLVPPCNNKTGSATGPVTPNAPAANSSIDAPVCPLTLSTVDCIKVMALQALPALLLGFFFTIAIAVMICVAVCLRCGRNKGRCSNWCRGRRDFSKTAKRNMHSLLGPSHQGFVKVKTFDSDSDGEDVIFQQF